MAGLVALVGSFFLLPLNGLERIGGVPIGDLLLLISALAAAVLCILERRLPPVPVWLGLGAILLTVGFLASEFLSGVEVGSIAFIEAEPRASAIGYFGRLLLAAIILPVVASVLARGWTPIRWLAIAWIAGVTLSCLVAFLDALLGVGIQVALSSTPKEVSIWVTESEPPRSVGLANHPNTLALTAVLVFPVAASFVRDQMTLLRLLPVLGLLSIAVIISGSRTGIIGLVLAVIGSLVLIRPFREAALGRGCRDLVIRAVALLSIALILVGGVLLGAGGSEFSAFDRLDQGDRSSSLSNATRRDYLSDSLSLIRERPLAGSGFQLIEYTHNVYLQPLVAGGVASFIGLLIVLAGFLRESVRLVRQGSAGTVPIATGLLLSLLIYLVSALFTNQVTDRYIFLGMALILAGSTVVWSGQAHVGRTRSDGKD